MNESECTEWLGDSCTRLAQGYYPDQSFSRVPSYRCALIWIKDHRTTYSVVKAPVKDGLRLPLCQIKARVHESKSRKSTLVNSTHVL